MSTCDSVCMAVTADQLAEEKVRALRRLELAVEGAYYQEATDEEITAAIEAGVEAARRSPLLKGRFPDQDEQG